MLVPWVSIVNRVDCSKKNFPVEVTDITPERNDSYGLAHATGVHERNTVPYARFVLKKRHGFCAKAREKKTCKGTD